ncbi:MAG: NAD(P)H-hydrate dehydratase [Lysobacterales bacterium]
MSDACYKLYTAAQVRGIDYAAIHELGIAGYELMCRAGRAIVDVARECFPEAQRWLILCGPGNNGGDGYVAARLATKAGIDVMVCSLVDPRQLKGDAARAYLDWQAQGGEVQLWPMSENHACDLALDALLGTGIDRAVSGEFRGAIAWLNQLDCPRLAIDIPSGLNADTGRPMGCCVQARNTVTFVGRKRGMYTADGPDFCGDIAFDDLAIPTEAARASSSEAGTLLTADFLCKTLKQRSRNTHKGNFGHVLAVGGVSGMSGAIRLCGEAALRSGAGKVTLATDPAHAGYINQGRPELMVKAIDGEAALRSLLEGDFTVALGPGLGTTDWSRALFNTCLDADAPMVVDADGLNLLAQRIQKSPVSHEQWILTPHPAEAARLLTCTVQEVQQDRVHAASEIAKRLGACVVLKGVGTVVANASGQYAICSAGNPGMATAGSGDVLTGIIAALLGQGLPCFDAARAGVLAHAMAGDFAAAHLSELGLLAGDITDALPEVWISSGQ